MDTYESPAVIASFDSRELLGEALASIGGSYIWKS
jgi:hypothetical protein